MPQAYTLVCVPAVDGVAIAPCGVVNGTALVPSVQAPEAFNGQSGPPLFEWSFTLAGGAFVLGLVIGSIIKVIRSA